MNWIILGGISILVTSSMVLLYKYYLLTFHWKPLLLNIFIFISIISILVILSNNNYNFIDIRKGYNILIPLLAIVLLLHYYYAYSAVAFSPNPAYPFIIIATGSIPVVLLSYLIFNNIHINIYTFIGIIITLIGIYYLIHSIKPNEKNISNDNKNGIMAK